MIHECLNADSNSLDSNSLEKPHASRCQRKLLLHHAEHLSERGGDLPKQKLKPCEFHLNRSDLPEKPQGSARFGKGVQEVLLLRKFPDQCRFDAARSEQKKRVKGLEPSTTTLATWCSTN